METIRFKNGTRSSVKLLPLQSVFDKVAAHPRIDSHRRADVKPKGGKQEKSLSRILEEVRKKDAKQDNKSHFMAGGDNGNREVSRENKGHTKPRTSPKSTCRRTTGRSLGQ